MSLRKLLFINSVKVAQLDESDVIPTVLYYEGGRALIGREARDKCTSPEFLVEDFKIELGRLDADNPVRRSSAADRSPRRTTLGLTKDFFDEVLKRLDDWVTLQGLAFPTKILIAEPLSLAETDKASESWLSNYLEKAAPRRCEAAPERPEDGESNGNSPAAAWGLTAAGAVSRKHPLATIPVCQRHAGSWRSAMHRTEAHSCQDEAAGHQQGPVLGQDWTHLQKSNYCRP